MLKLLLKLLRAAEADRYVPAEFRVVQDSLNAAMTEIENQKSKFVFFRSYKKVGVKLNNVATLANTVKESAGVQKEEVKIQAQQTLAEATSLVAEVKALIVKAPRGKEGKEALEAIKQ